VAYSPVILDAIQDPESTLSRHARTEWKTWGKKLIDNDNIIGNWPAKAATKTILIRSSKIGDSLADDHRAILLAILQENEARRLFVGKRPKGMRLTHVLVLCALIYILIQVRIGLSEGLTASASFVLSISQSTLGNHTPLLHPNPPQHSLLFRCVLAPCAHDI